MSNVVVIDNATGEVVDLPAAARSLALELPASLSFEGWAEVGKDLAAYERGVQWLIGDWWAFGEHHYGERAAAAASGIFGRAFDTLRACGVVARAFPKETCRRRHVLTFSHHREVAMLAAPQADALLDEAERDELSVRELRQARNQRRVAASLPAAPAEGQAPDLGALAATGRRFGTIYADPPWLYDNQGTRAATGNHYNGMSVEDLAALPVGDLAAPDAHLHLWTTNAFLFECPRLFDAWGFEFRSSFVWVKPQMGIGNYWRSSHEFLLTAVRGDALRFADHSLRSWLESDRGAHSAKPEEVRGFIERASPGPRLELFARRPAAGWVVWGDQVEDAEVAA